MLLTEKGGVHSTQASFQVLPFVVDEGLLSKVRPVVLGDWFAVEDLQNELEHLIGLGLSVFNLDLAELLNIDVIRKSDPTIPLLHILLMLDLNLTLYRLVSRLLFFLSKLLDVVFKVADLLVDIVAGLFT